MYLKKLYEPMERISIHKKKAVYFKNPKYKGIPGPKKSKSSVSLFITSIYSFYT